MAIEIPDSEPARVRAGDTVTWRKTLDAYPASDGWTLHYRLINVGGRIDIATTADGAAHLVSVLPDVSTAWTAGDYTRLAWVSKGDDRVTLAPGRITVDPDLAAFGAGYDGRSRAKKMLDAIDAALLGLATGERLAVVEAEAAGRRVKYDLAGLTTLRNIYAAQVRSEESAERVALGLGARNKINVRL